MREMATSGGYMVSLGSQKIYSNTGSINWINWCDFTNSKSTSLFDKSRY